MKLLVTGTGRCGTGFMAKVLSEAGFPCTHEGVYRFHGPVVDSYPPAESSWMAVPYLDRVSAPVVLVFRHPAAVVRSLLGTKFFETPGPYRDFAFQHEPDLAQMTYINAAWTWWLRWNLRALPHATAVVEVDNVDWGRIAPLIDVEAKVLADAAEVVGTSYNSRDRAPASVLVRADRHLIAEAIDLYQHLT